jgi:glucan 1,3-beta-glucosidase
VIDSSDIFIYGSGHYSFFNNYDTSCNTFENGSNCQARMVSLEGDVSNFNIYCLNTVGTENMATRDGRDLARWQDNVNTFCANIMLFRPA